MIRRQWVETMRWPTLIIRTSQPASFLVACYHFFWQSFEAGRAARTLQVADIQNDLLEQYQKLFAGDACHAMSRPPNSAVTDDNRSERRRGHGDSMRDPSVLKEEQIDPRTTSASNTFDSTCSSTSSESQSIMQESSSPTAATSDLNDVQDATRECRASVAHEEGVTHAGDWNAKDQRLPIGKHLLVDLQNVDPAFLSSQERLVGAIHDFAGECGLAPLSFHCKQLQHKRLSCAVFLLQSNIFFRTWPLHGVIAVDLFTWGPKKSLLPNLPSVESLFSIPNRGAANEDTSQSAPSPRVRWAHKIRGFQDSFDLGAIALRSDMNFFPVGIMTDFKKEVRKP
jgi:S-adenosylmethionine/arginine decarboxylase-like enzyme